MTTIARRHPRWAFLFPKAYPMVSSLLTRNSNPAEVLMLKCDHCGDQARGTAEQLDADGWGHKYCPDHRNYVAPAPGPKPVLRHKFDGIDPFADLQQACALLTRVAAAESTEFDGRHRAAITDLYLAVSGSGSITQAVIVEFKKAYRVLGAPGDWGYGYADGEGLRALYDTWNTAVKQPRPAVEFDPIALGC
jgi:hypothetical protein